MEKTDSTKSDSSVLNYGHTSDEWGIKPENPKYLVENPYVDIWNSEE